MKFRNGLALGLGIGYVFGTKAGKARYQQIQRAFDRIAALSPIPELAEKGRAVTEIGAVRARQVAGDGMSEAAARLRSRLDDH